MKLLGRLHLLTDTHIQQRYAHRQLAEMAFSVGSPEVVLQYREKAYAPERHHDELLRIGELARRHGNTLLINDYVDLAAEIGCGTHIGKEDLPPTRARDLLGPEAIIGLTVHTDEELEAANTLDVIDYVGIGPVFGTTTKYTPRPPLQLEGLRRLCERSRHRVIAIGNIGNDTLPQVLAQGAYGVAVLSAWINAPKPTKAVEGLLSHLN